MTAADQPWPWPRSTQIPHGDLSQNTYRAAVENALFNGLGSRPEIAATIEAAHALALTVVRQGDLDFIPRRR